jgi:hypothetical protein
MSSSRSIAAARARRSNEQAPPVNGSRPITSIGSQAAFSPMPQQPTNIRLPRGQPQQQMYQQMPPPPSQMYQQMPQAPPQGQGQSQSLPFSKLSISDAVGLITLRLGRIEQFMIELNNGEHEYFNNGSSNIPENSKIIDNSVLTNIISRVESIEKKEPLIINNEHLTQVNEEIKTLQEHIKKLNDELVKTNLAAAKHSEQVLRFERDFVENKDILKSLLIKFDLFVKETNEKFGDFDYAISEIENSIQTPVTEDKMNVETDNLQEGEFVNESTENDPYAPLSFLQTSQGETFSSNIMAIDLKNAIKQELANEDIH